MVGDVEKQAAAGGRAPLKIAVLLPYPVRKIRTPVPSSGVQEYPGVEPQYTSTTMRGMRDATREVCGKLRCCFALDAWEAAYAWMGGIVRSGFRRLRTRQTVSTQGIASRILRMLIERECV